MAIWLALKAGTLGLEVALNDEVAVDDEAEGAQPDGKSTTNSATAIKKCGRRGPQECVHCGMCDTCERS